MDEGRRSALKKICFTAAGVAGGIPLLGTVRAASKTDKLFEWCIRDEIKFFP